MTLFLYNSIYSEILYTSSSNKKRHEIRKFSLRDFIDIFWIYHVREIGHVLFEQ